MSRTWLITGSGRGLGRALAEAVLASGDRLLATARQPSQLAELARVHVDRVRTFALDVTDPAGARDAVAAAVQAFGTLDVVVNNAGYANMGSIEDIDEADFRAQIETNLWGVVNVTRAALPVLRRQRRGHIVQVSSVGGRLGSPGLGPYQTAKWAVEGFSEVLAKEVRPLGIKVTVIEPGGVRTDWAGSSMALGACGPDYDATVGAMVRRLKGHTGKETGDPARCAQAILRVVALDDPPLRLLLGRDAFGYARAMDEARIAADEQWKALSFSTDYDA
ncbi:MAG: oxidoreductase [Gammaproteobacteria bacterium]